MVLHFQVNDVLIKYSMNSSFLSYLLVVGDSFGWDVNKLTVKLTLVLSSFFFDTGISDGASFVLHRDDASVPSKHFFFFFLKEMSSDTIVLCLQQWLLWSVNSSSGHSTQTVQVFTDFLTFLKAQ